ncbi:MAG: hypothetical protein AAF066_15560 [Pseudomonadota bacterium]
MTLISRRRFTASLFACSAAAGCAPFVPEQAPDEVSQLGNGIVALNPSIDPLEAFRAADIAVNYPKLLREQYGVTDPPLIHNIKVNSGARPRGLCWQWADDMQTRLSQESFQTLTMHRAIANAFSRLLIDHSTVIMSANGDTMNQGMVLDPWRYGGTLFWSPTLEDKKYEWVEREVVFAWKRERGLLKTKDPSSEAVPISS